MSDNEIDELSKQFYTVLINKREKLDEFLGNIKLNHNILYRMFQNIMKNNKVTVSELLLGLVGPEYNKQKAVYEIPTYEVMILILAIIKYFKIEMMEELMAGSGLFSSLFNKFNKYHNNKLDIIATDGFCQLETIASNLYYPVEKKYILEYLLDDKIEQYNKIYISLWPAINCQKIYFTEFINKIKPQYFILIGQKDIYDDYFNEFMVQGYKMITFTTYQLCYKDSVSNDNNLDDIYHSTMSLFIKDNEKNNQELTNDIMDVVKTLTSLNIFRSSEQKINDKYLLKYFTEQHYIPSEMINNITELEIKELIKYLYEYTASTRKELIPYYLTNMSEFRFWYRLVLDNKIPHLLKTYDKFKEFKDLYENIEIQPFIPSHILELKNNNIIPEWVNNKQEALKCLLLDYSTNDKIWKQSRGHMNNYYNQIFNIN